MTNVSEIFDINDKGDGLVVIGTTRTTAGSSSSRKSDSIYNSRPYSKIFSLKHDNNEKFISDFVKLLKSSDYYDTEIKVGKDQDFKTFKTHSTILKARSPYFDRNLSKKDDNGIFISSITNISPKIFDFILNGFIDIIEISPDEIFQMLEACHKLEFMELLDTFQDFLIENAEDWIQREIVKINKISSGCLSFTPLQDYCAEAISYSPELFFQSCDFKKIEKPILITILKRNSLSMKEIEIWEYVIQWAVAQNNKLGVRHISEQNDEELTELKQLLDDIIPLIRFDQISHEEFYHNIKPHEKIFNENIYKEIENYYYVGNWLTKSIQKGSRLNRPKSKRMKLNLLNAKVRCLIASWIDEKKETYQYSNIPYEFKLIHRGSQHGFNNSAFLKSTYNIKQTIIIMKIKDTGELIGGYNRLYWYRKDTFFTFTNKGLIFKISDQRDVSKGLKVLDRVDIPYYFVKNKNSPRIHSYFQFSAAPYYGRNSYAAFDGLYLNGKICHFENDKYKEDLDLKKESLTQALEDCEVYQIIKRV